MKPQDKLNEKTRDLGIGTHVRHIFLCADPSKPKCCSADKGLEAWDFLKSRLKELDLDMPNGVYRTKANCLRIKSISSVVYLLKSIAYSSDVPR